MTVRAEKIIETLAKENSDQGGISAVGLIWAIRGLLGVSEERAGDILRGVLEKKLWTSRPSLELTAWRKIKAR